MPKKRTTKSPKGNSKKSSFIARTKASRAARRKKSLSFLNKLRKISVKTKLLLTLGTVLILIPFLFYVNEGIQLAFFTPHVTAVTQQQLPPPVWISIPKVNIELPVQETALQGNTWEIADHAISHLAISARPGENGPIIFYGHNTNDRFGPIRWLKIGDTITIHVTGNKSYSYKIVRTTQVDPNQVNLLVEQQTETLILYTCDGFADLKRFVVIAKPF